MADQTKTTLPGLSQGERDLLKKLLANPLEFPPEFAAWMRSYLTANPPETTIGQILGFHAAGLLDGSYTPSLTRDDAEVQWDSLTYGNPNLAGAAGPEVTGIPAGRYVIDYGAAAQAEGSQSIFINLAVNGAMPADDSNCIESSVAAITPGATSMLVDLPNATNTLTMVYRCSGSTGHSARRRWIKVVKYANL